MDKSYGIIYKATNIVNEKVYVGQTVQTLRSRQIKHESTSRRKKPTYHFGKALNKYDLNSFKWEVIHLCDSKEEMDQMERYYIKKFNSYKNGYNETTGGYGTCGRKQSEATKKLISFKKTGIPLSKEHREKLSKMRKGVKKSKNHIDNVAFAKSQFWEVTYPDNKIEIIRNLSLFCRENNLNDRGMWFVANGYRNQHKGFGCKKIGKSKDKMVKEVTQGG